MSPTIFRSGELRFFFFSREDSRMRVHVQSPEGEAKFWLKPAIASAQNHGLKGPAVYESLRLIRDHEQQMLNVELASPGHLRWPTLDIDLSVDSIDRPDDFPLVSKATAANPSEDPVPRKRS